MHIHAITIRLTLSVLILVAIPAVGHESHSHDPVSQSQAEAIAIKNVAKLVNKGKIDKSWKSLKAATTEMKTIDSGSEWVIIFINKNIKDPSKQTLYVFLTLGGKYLAANYTGK